MGLRFVRSVLAQDEAVVASTVITYDLPVNPLSHVLLTIKFLNSTGVITDYTQIIGLLTFLSQVQILYKGQAIISLNGLDLAILTAQLTKWQPYAGNIVKTNGDVRWLTIPIPLGRRPFDPVECFPAVKKGELQLQINYGATPTGLATPVAQIETVELLDATPKQFLKYTTFSKTAPSTGFQDLDLPIGNDILGLLVFGTTVPSAASFNATVGQSKILLNNVEYGYSFANWETMHGELMNKCGWVGLQDHFHRGNFVTTVEGDTGLAQYDDTWIQRYAYLDYDPLGDGMYAIPTAGQSRVTFRYNQEPAADAMRAIPVELIKLAG